MSGKGFGPVAYSRELDRVCVKGDKSILEIVSLYVNFMENFTMDPLVTL